MTTTIAAALLQDVPRFASPDGNLLAEEDVLAALSAHLDPALAERVGEVVERLREGMPETFDATEGYAPSVSLAEERMADAADLITALLAQNTWLKANVEAGDLVNGLEKNRAEAAEAERDDAVIKRAAWELEAKTLQVRLTAAEAQIATLTAQVERLEAAIRELKRCWYQGDLTENDFRAALTETATTEDRT